MGRLLVWGLAVWLGLSGVASAATTASAAGAQTFSWSGPVEVAPGGSLGFVECETARFCTALSTVNGDVTAVSFDPADPGSPTDVPLGDSPGPPLCASSTVCLLRETDPSNPADDDLLSFDPSDAATPVTSVLSASADDEALGCADANLCVVASYANNDDTVTAFNPTTGAVISTLTDGDDDVPADLACSAETQCTLAFGSGDVATFNPETLSAAGTLTSAPLGLYAKDLICFSTTQCIEVDNAPDAITFNPQAPSDADSAPLPAKVLEPDCVSATFCVATDASGQVIFGNPQSSAAWTPGQFPVHGGEPAGVACASPTLCVATDGGSGIFVATAATATMGSPGRGPTTKPKSKPKAGAPKATVGRAAVAGVQTTAGGLTVTLRCRGAKEARCRFRLSLAAGISSGPAAQRSVTLGPGSRAVRLTLVPAAARLLHRYGELGGVLTVSEQLVGGTQVLARRSVTLHAAGR